MTILNVRHTTSTATAAQSGSEIIGSCYVRATVTIFV